MAASPFDAPGDKDDMISPRLCSRSGGDPTISCTGDVSTWCLRCIMESDWSLTEKMSALSKVLKNPEFLNAEKDYSTIQVMILTEIHSVLIQKRALRLYGPMFKNDFIKYLEFVSNAGLGEAIPKLAKVRLSRSMKTDFNRQWYSVGYYCVSILGLISRLEGAKDLVELGIRPLSSYCERVEAVKNDFLVRSMEGGIMSDILSMMAGGRGVIELFRSPWALKGILAAYPGAYSLLVDADGLSVLCKMFAPGVIQDLVETRIRSGKMMNYDQTLLGFDHGSGPRPVKSTYKMTDEELIEYVQYRFCEVLEDIGDVLVAVCKYNRSYCFQLLDHSPVATWLRWLKVPLRDQSDILGVRLSIRLLLVVIKQRPKAAEVLAVKHGLIVLLEPVLYLSYDSVLGPLLQILKIMLQIQGEPRKMVMRSSRILHGVACLIHTSVRSLQIDAFDILNDILKSDTRQLLIDLVGRELLRKVQVLVGIAGAKHDEEIRSRWIRLNKYITQYCDDYVEQAADSDRYLIQRSEAIGPADEVDAQQIELRKRGNSAFTEGRYRAAVEAYTVGLLLASVPSADINAVLYSNRAECYLRLRKFENAVFDATRSINCMFKSSSVYSKTCFRRAKGNFAVGHYLEAFHDVAVCVNLDPKEPKFRELYTKLEEMWKKDEFASTDKFREEVLFASDAEYRWKEMERERHKAKKEAIEKEKSMQEKQHKTKTSEKQKQQDTLNGAEGAINEKKEIKKKKVHVCAECGTQASGMKKCGRCATYFCNKECQSKAWPKHKLICK